ncbi:Ig-like domain-containing protein [Tenacibaculum agarivorans]|uniref:Ig-like domain-containing protein n=1 Tax=Tenacibaculum agarivorans TaxID=1908389 RepID=UPI00094BBE2E|nr:Ig-like domain-containing protein [Tenacibaculum agarivorans]
MKTYFISFFWLLVSLNLIAQDWSGINIPANPPSGMVWELNPVSDSFNYESTNANQHPEFTKRWNNLYINSFSGPSNTAFNRDHSWVTNGNLNIHAALDQQFSIIYTGCISSKAQMTYPMYMEARVKQANCMLANNIWMISEDETEELDMLESYPNSQTGREWFDQRIHLSHHTFIRNPFTDYQPRDEEEVFGTWYYENDRESWRGEYFTIGVYWVNPHHAEYYINGVKVRTIKKNEHSFIDPDGNLSEHTTDFDALDKYGYTGGTGLSKPQHIIINMEQQSWLSDLNIYPTDEELDDANGKNLFQVDWIRVYDAVPTGGNIPVTDVAITPRNVSIRPGETFQLDAVISPANATKKIVTWSSANTAFLTVNGQGLIKGVKAGNIVIQVKTFDGGFTDGIVVNISGEPVDDTPQNIPTTGVSVLPPNLTLNAGETTQLTASVIPFNATNKAVTWSSSDINVATVSTTGLVTAIDDGTATITGKTLSGDNTDTSIITVTGGDGEDPDDTTDVIATGITVTPANTTLEIGQTTNLTATIVPSNTTNKTVTWSSNNTSLATVTASGVVTAIASGNVIITATTADGSNLTDTATITVNSTTPNEQTPFKNHTIPGVINAVDFDNGGQGIAYNDTTTGNNGSGARQNTDVDTENRISTGNIGWIAAGEWLEYTVNVATSGNYDLNVQVASTGNNGAFHVEFDGVDKTGVQSVNSTGDWGTFVAQTISNVSLAAGQQVMRVFMDGGAFNLGSLTFNQTTTTDPGQLITIQAENFTTTGGTFNDAFAGGPGLGVNRTATTINYVNNGDYADYSVTIPEDGTYEIVYYISSPNTGTTIAFGSPSTVFNTTNVPNNGSWDDYQPLTASQTVDFTSGNHTIRLTAAPQIWTWNLDKFTLQKVQTVVSRSAIIKDENPIQKLEVVVYPNPSDGVFTVLGLDNGKQSFKIVNALGITVKEIDIPVQGHKVSLHLQSLSAGIYFIATKDFVKQIIIK